MSFHNNWGFEQNSIQFVVEICKKLLQFIQRIDKITVLVDSINILRRIFSNGKTKV